ncbi:MAG: hypothetical protein CVV64_16950 [Candidatus Wallbacteria bacterium HGW-Wallbacteria-1]|jgi:hypothetical protein|uniref:Uncharacterized protein n=1 Tax=Candidatus Wallbacteria bacterium HGW-Wallbacteria-1 TaxID=2013854 RepID=A0A2N1PKJ0_9BACT|nr:MAG: hypothetical protein CVV64_16950 [Candidatus Wallbacteria bacterium HGW-Wallbacteria-1]
MNLVKSTIIGSLLILIFSFPGSAPASELQKTPLTREDVSLVLEITEAVKNVIPTPKRDFYDILGAELKSRNLSMNQFLDMKGRVDRAVYAYLERFTETDRRGSIQHLNSLLTGLRSQLTERMEIQKSKDQMLENHISTKPAYLRWKAFGEEINHLNRKLKMLNQRLKEVSDSDKFTIIEELTYNERNLEKYRAAFDVAEKQKQQLLDSITPDEVSDLFMNNETIIEGLENDIGELTRLLSEANSTPSRWQEIRNSLLTDDISDGDKKIVEENLDRLLVYIGKRNQP